MGKNGDALRAAKKQHATFTITREWLEAHDNSMKELYKKAAREAAEKWVAQEKERIDKEVEKEWQQREKEFGGAGSEERFLKLLEYMLSVCTKVLIQEFGWKAVPKDRNPHPATRIVRFSNAVAKEVNLICEDENLDVRRYSEEVYELYGVKYGWKEVE